MNLNDFDFTKETDIHRAIDELNYLIADCIVSRAAFELWREYESELDYILDLREKAFESWLGMYTGLHMAIGEVKPVSKTLYFFNLMQQMFDTQKQKLHWVTNRPYPYLPTANRKKEKYGLPQYFYKKENKDGK